VGRPTLRLRVGRKRVIRKTCSGTLRLMGRRHDLQRPARPAHCRPFAASDSRWRFGGVGICLGPGGSQGQPLSTGPPVGGSVPRAAPHLDRHFFSLEIESDLKPKIPIWSKIVQDMRPRQNYGVFSLSGRSAQLALTPASSGYHAGAGMWNTACAIPAPEPTRSRPWRSRSTWTARASSRFAIMARLWQATPAGKLGSLVILTPDR
jgi:hypothetical protein